MVAMRRARHEARRIVWKYCRQRLRHHVGEFVLLDGPPNVEEEASARPQGPARLPVSLDLVGKEHHAELASHDIEATIAERQRERVGLFPLDPALGLSPRCLRSEEHTSELQSRQYLVCRLLLEKKKESET